MPVSSSARRHLEASTSTTAASNEAATSARSRSSSECLRTQSNAAVFRPLKLKSRSSLANIGRGNAKRFGSPPRARSARAGPPG